MSPEQLQQRFVLAFLKAHREVDPSFGRSIWYEWPKLLYASLFVGFGCLVAMRFAHTPGVLLIGFGLGVIAMHLVQLRGRLKVFRIYRGVADWERVDSLLAQSPEA